MNNCKQCRFARWQKTKAGKLHTSGDGGCTWDGWKRWQIPAAFYYMNSENKPPAPQGGPINRRNPPTEKCPFFQHIKPETGPTPPPLPTASVDPIAARSAEDGTPGSDPSDQPPPAR
jgi:hypothetical protein